MSTLLWTAIEDGGQNTLVSPMAVSGHSALSGSPWGNVRSGNARAWITREDGEQIPYSLNQQQKQQVFIKKISKKISSNYYKLNYLFFCLCRDWRGCMLSIIIPIFASGPCGPDLDEPYFLKGLYPIAQICKIYPLK